MEITIRDVCMTYPNGKKALNHVDMQLESPSLVGLVGPNGAGKSTLMKLLVAGLMKTSGSIAVDGKPLEDNEKALKSRLGYLPQEFGLYEELTVYRFLDYIAALKGLGRNAGRAVEEVLEKTRLEEKRNARIRTLSGGQRQRVGIAQAILGNPDLLILDEPTVGLDPEERVSFRNLFSKSARGKIVILSTHIIEDVQSVCDRLIVMNRGVILFNGKPQELIRNARGHVGIYEASADEVQHLEEKEYRITARLFTANGIACRIVGEALPSFAFPAEPTLEDAYMLLMAKAGEAS